MSQSLFRRCAEWFRRLLRRNRSRASVDSGRSAYVRLPVQEQRLQKSLLKKINAYWTQKRLARRPAALTEQRGRGLWRGALLVICLVAASILLVTGKGPGGLASLLASLDYFRLTGIEIRGCRHSSAQELQTASGVTISTSLFAVDAEAVGAAVQSADDWVKSARVVKIWPDELLIEVDEYEPYALITRTENHQTGLYYLDRDGVPFLKTKAGMDLDYPVITGLEGVMTAQEHEGLAQAMAFLRLVAANNPNLPAQSVSEVHVDASGELIVYLVEHPFPIIFGGGEVRQKYLRLRKVLEVLYKPRKEGMDIARVAYIRMNYLKDRVIVGYRES
jgi:cell division protein FtsQ